MRRAAKVDGNQRGITNGLRAAGATVQSLAKVGEGAPDLLVGWKGVNTLLELKVPGEKLNDNQLEWHRCWQGIVWVVHTLEEAFQAVGISPRPVVPVTTYEKQKPKLTRVK